MQHQAWHLSATQQLTCSGLSGLAEERPVQVMMQSGIAELSTTAASDCQAMEAVVGLLSG